MVKKNLYQDRYNKAKTWEVAYMVGGVYLKQFINGVQFGKGIRCTKKFVNEIGITGFEQIS